MVNAHFKPAERGARFRPPTLHVLYRGPTTTTDGDAPEWRRWEQDARIHAEAMRWGSNGRMTTMTLRVALGAHGTTFTRTRPEDASKTIIGNGDEILVKAADEGASAWGDKAREVFRGWVGQEHALIQSNPDVESYTVTAYGPELRLAGKAVHGQWVRYAVRDDAEIAGSETAAGAERNYVAQTSLPVIFNRGGKANASDTAFRLATCYTASGYTGQNKCCVFDATKRLVKVSGTVTVQAAHWTAYTALRSLVEWVDDYDVISPATPWAEIEGLIGSTIIGQVPVEGLSLLEAIRAVLLPVGFGFYLDMRSDNVAGGAEASKKRRFRLHVYSLRSQSWAIRPPMAPTWNGVEAGDSVWSEASMVQRLEDIKDGHSIRNEITVVGDQRRRQVVLQFGPSAITPDLVPCWDVSEHDLSDWVSGGVCSPVNYPSSQETRELFEKRYKLHGPEHHSYPNEYRTFVWNEDGQHHDYASTFRPGSEEPDLSDYGIGDDTNYARRPRPVGPTLLKVGDGETRTFPAHVQMGIYEAGSVNAVDTDSWVACPAVPLADRAGFTITRETLVGDGDNDWCPWTAKNTPEEVQAKYEDLNFLTALYNSLHATGTYRLVIRLVGSVECDNGIEETASRQLDTPWPFTMTGVVTKRTRFRWQEVTSAADLGLTDQHDEVEDDDAAQLYARQIREALEHATCHGSIVMRGLHFDVHPGLQVPGTLGRQVDLSVDGSTRTHWPVIVGVDYLFAEGTNKTELVLETALLAVPK